jgi:hypothetical protein
MSALGQKRTWPALFNHFVGAGEQRDQYLYAGRFGGLEIYHQLKFRLSDPVPILRITTGGEQVCRTSARTFSVLSRD